MEWPSYGTDHGPPVMFSDRRGRPPHQTEAPPRLYRNVAPYYAGSERASNYQDGYEMPSQYMPNPLAAYAVPPYLPGLSGPVAGRLLRRRETFDRRTPVNHYSRPSRRSANVRHFRRAENSLLYNDAPYETTPSYDLEATIDDPDDGEPDDQPNLKLWLGGKLVHTKVASSTPAEVSVPTSKPPKGKRNPYNETIERIHHS
ncbi:MAG: hypothetical protein Q9223_003875, partial [Gallowayella weberi]